MAPLVSIIMPAYNAAATIAQAIASATAQTHRAIEIIVVDDGSTDETAAIVAGIARGDQRIRLISQNNQGVSAARNRAIDAAMGQYIAPLDSDDIWHPEKTERQLLALEAAPPDVALAYSWFRRIDDQGRVIPGSPHPRIVGWVFHQHLGWNFISNGSTALFRAESLSGIRYETTLPGAEDFLLQLQLARRYRFLCVPAYLTGYRKVSGSLSSKAAQMIESHLRMYEIITASASPPAERVVMPERARLLVELARNHLRRRKWASATRLLAKAIREEPRAAVRTIAREFRGALEAASRSARSNAPNAMRDFMSYLPEEHDGPWAPKRSSRRLASLRQLDGLG